MPNTAVHYSASIVDGAASRKVTEVYVSDASLSTEPAGLNAWLVALDQCIDGVIVAWIFGLPLRCRPRSVAPVALALPLHRWDAWAGCASMSPARRNTGPVYPGVRAGAPAGRQDAGYYRERPRGVHQPHDQRHPYHRCRLYRGQGRGCAHEPE